MARSGRFRRGLRLAGQWATMLFLLLCAAVLAETGMVKNAVSYVDAHKASLLWTLGTALAVGIALLVLGIVMLVATRGERLTHSEAEAVGTSRPGGVWTHSQKQRFQHASGVQADDSFRITDLKEAFRSGAAFQHPVWRRRLVTTVGGILTVLAGFSVAVVLVPVPFLKVVIATAVLYAVVRLSWAFYRA
jgi:hypothetical protein